MNVLKETIRNHATELIVVVAKIVRDLGSEEEFRKTAVKLKITSEESIALREAYESKLTNKSFIIRGAVIGTTVKKILKSYMSKRYDEFFNDVDFKVQMLINQNDELELYILIQGKFYNFVYTLLNKMMKQQKLEYAISDTLLDDSNGITSVKIPAGIVPNHAIWNNAFKLDVLDDDNTCPLFNNQIVISRSMSIRKYLEKVFDCTIKEDKIILFSYQTNSFYMNSIDTVSFTMHIKTI